MNNLDQFATWRDRVDGVMHQDIWWQGFIWGAIVGLAAGCVLGIVSYSVGYYGTAFLSRRCGRVE